MRGTGTEIVYASTSETEGQQGQRAADRQAGRHMCTCIYHGNFWRKTAVLQPGIEQFSNVIEDLTGEATDKCSVSVQGL